MDEYERYTELCHHIKNVEKKIDSILLKLESIDRNASKMSSHIDFVDKTYVKMSSPLWWICDKVNLIKGNKLKENLTIRSTIEDQD